MRFRYKLLIGVILLTVGWMFAEGHRQKVIFPRLADRFHLPGEAKVTGGWEHSELMGGRYQVAFRLPETRTPEEWVAYLHETAQGGAHVYHGSPLKLEGGGDYWRIEYVAPRKEFEMEYRWD